LFLEKIEGLDTYRVVIPYLVFKHMVTDIKVLFSQVMDPLSDAIAYNFEKIQIEWRRFLISFYLKHAEIVAAEKKNPPQPVIKKLRDLLPGALGHGSRLDKEIQLRDLRVIEFREVEMQTNLITQVAVSKDPISTVNMLEDPIIGKNKEKASSFDSATVNKTQGGIPFVEAHQYKSDESPEVPFLRNGIGLGHGRKENDILQERDKLNRGHTKFFGDLDVVFVVISNRPLKHYHLIKSNLERGLTGKAVQDVIPEDVLIVCNENFKQYSSYLSQFLWKQAVIEMDVHVDNIQRDKEGRVGQGNLVNVPTTALKSYDTLCSTLALLFKPTVDPKKVVIQRIYRSEPMNLKDESVWELDNPEVCKMLIKEEKDSVSMIVD